MAADVVKITYTELEEIAQKNEERKRQKEEKQREQGKLFISRYREVFRKRIYPSVIFDFKLTVSSSLQFSLSRCNHSNF